MSLNNLNRALEELRDGDPKESKEDIEDHESSHEYYFDALTAHQATIVREENNQKAAEKNIHELKDELKSIEQELGASNRLLPEEKTQEKKIKEEVQKKIVSAKTEKAKVEQLIKDEKAAIKSLEDNRAASMKRRGTLEKKLLEQVKVINGGFKTKKENLENSISDSAEKLNRIERRLKIAKESLGRMESKISDLESKPQSKYRIMNERMTKKIAYLKIGKKDIEESISELEVEQSDLTYSEKTKLQKLEKTDPKWSSLNSLDNDLLNLHKKIHETPAEETQTRKIHESDFHEKEGEIKINDEKIMKFEIKD